MSTRATIAAEVEQVAKEQNKRLAPLSDDLILLDSGLDSLCFAILVARLEQRLGFDPFSAAEDVYFPVTFGDFVRFYDEARQ
ncbi:MAG: acyl carrier protein [Hyphomicrobiaceae bacterium]|jgi:acyl carrier protein|nr:acyl carrier protein [Hyphomicrobiaceae bacterium]